MPKRTRRNDGKFMSDDFRKKMHVAYKKKLADIIWMFICSLEDEDGFDQDPKGFVERWVDSVCLPMGDFSKEDAIKQIEEWQK